MMWPRSIFHWHHIPYEKGVIEVLPGSYASAKLGVDRKAEGSQFLACTI